MKRMTENILQKILYAWMTKNGGNGDDRNKRTNGIAQIIFKFYIIKKTTGT